VTVLPFYLLPPGCKKCHEFLAVKGRGSTVYDEGNRVKRAERGERTRRRAVERDNPASTPPLAARKGIRRRVLEKGGRKRMHPELLAKKRGSRARNGACCRSGEAAKAAGKDQFDQNPCSEGLERRGPGPPMQGDLFLGGASANCGLPGG